MSRAWIPTVVIALLPSCSHDWDSYDPRLGGGGAPATSGPGSTASGDMPSSTSGETVGTTTSGGSTSASTGDGGASSSQGGGGEGTTGGAGGGGGGAGPATLVYEADVADCIDPVAPDPDACEAGAGFARMSIDAESQTGEVGAWEGYIRVPIGDEVAGRTIVAVRLRLHVADVGSADSDSTGAVWEVEPFTRDDLFVSAPARLAQVAPGRGPVVLGDVVELPLEGVEVAAGGAVFLGLATESTNGVDYINTNGATPPALVVDVE